MNIATQDDEEMVSFRAERFDRARGATIYTLNLPVELQCSWRQPESAIDALLNRRIGGKPVLHVD